MSAVRADHRAALALELDDLRGELARLRGAVPERIDIDPDQVERDLARLVLSLVEFLREVLERQAVRRMENGTLEDDEVERIGLALERLERKIAELARTFGLEAGELRLRIGMAGG